jgi:hypothetical protein
MPTKVQVKVNTVNHTTQTSNAGNELNYVEITGFDSTNNKGFKKRFFATKKDGTATKNAETADTLNQDDWIEITLDDTSYHNVQTLKKIQEPAGMTAPSQGSTASGNPKGSGGSKGGYKGNPAKDKAIARSVALKAAVDFSNPVEDGVDEVLAKAQIFEEYLMGGSTMTVDGEIRETAPNGNVIQNATTPPVEDDDIPF